MSDDRIDLRLTEDCVEEFKKALVLVKNPRTRTPEVVNYVVKGSGANNVCHELAWSDPAVVRILRQYGNPELSVDPAVKRILSDRSMDTNQKLFALSKSDSRYEGWTAVRLGELIGVTDRAIRDTEWWQRNGKRRKEDG